MSTAASASREAVAQRFRRELTGKRVFIGFAVAIVGIATIFNPLWFAILIVTIAVIGAVEFSNLARRAGGEVALPIAIAACAAYPTLAYFQLLGRFEGLLVVTLVVASFIASLSASLERFGGRVAMTVLAALYLGKLLSYLVLLRAGHNGLIETLWLVIVVALTDTVGMLAGLGFGQNKLAPRLSPSKTWEGAIAALSAAILAGAFMWWLAGIGGPWWLAVVFPLSVSLAAQFGDLVESAFKRNAQVKDSGHLIAGHGGVLDRFDSYLFAGVIGYAVLLLAARL